jgi:hypothetical protein
MSTSSAFSHFIHQNKILLTVLLLAFINGLIFWIVIPPWWHYDEPGHFEYAWLMANDPKSIQTGEVNETFRKELGKSLVKYNWYAVRNYEPDLTSSEPLWIGVPQVGDEPGYYFLLSLPLRLIKGADLLVQYNVCRFISFLLFLLTVFFTWKITTSLFSTSNPLTWMIPVFMSTLPGLVDTMTSVSNDVAAIFAFTLFLYASIRLLQHKSLAGTIVLFVFSIVCCYYSKNIAWFGIILAPVVVLFAALPGRIHMYLVAAGILLGVIVVVAAFDQNGAADWFLQDSSERLSRENVSAAPDGSFAHSELFFSDAVNGRVGQCFTPQTIMPLDDQPMTYGAWIWASQPAEVASPYFNFVVGGLSVTSEIQTIKVDTTPRFFSFNITVPQYATRGCINLHPIAPENKQIKIYYDRFILTQGTLSANAPSYSADQQVIKWDGKKVTNLIKNASFEQPSLRLKPWVEKIGYKIPFVAGHLSMIVSTVIIPNTYAWFYRDSFGLMFHTFWGDIAGDKVVLPGAYTQIILFCFTLLGVTGFIIKCWKKRKNIRLDIAVLFLFALMMVIGATIIRGIANVLDVDALLSWARYFMPAIVPISVVLCAGWLEWFEIAKSLTKIQDFHGRSIYFALLYSLFIASLISAMTFFNPQSEKVISLILLIVTVFGLYHIVLRISKPKPE